MVRDRGVKEGRERSGDRGKVRVKDGRVRGE